MTDVFICTTTNVEDIHGPIFLNNIPKHHSLSLESLLISQSGFEWGNLLRFEFISVLPRNSIKLVLNLCHVPIDNRIYLSKKQLGKINKTENAFLWIFSPWEGVINKNELLNEITKCGIKKEKVIVTTSCQRYKGIIDGVKFIPISDWWEGQYNHHLKHFSNVSYIGLKTKQDTINQATKKFLCLNRNLKHHRVWTYYTILEKNLIDQGYVSYHLPTIAETEANFNWIKFVDRSLNCITNVDNEIKKQLFKTRELDNLNKKWIINYQSEIVPYYNNSLFSIVTESLLDEEFITEKTFKAMMHCHPYVIIGSKKISEKLRQRGYKTFESIFGIDSIETVEELRDFLNLINETSIEKWQQKILNEWDKVEHNWKLFFNSKVYYKNFKTDLLKALS